jgi:hypothetical protein
MTWAKAKDEANKTFIVQASLLIITYNHKNIFIVQATVPDLIQFTINLAPWLWIIIMDENDGVGTSMDRAYSRQCH